MDTRLQWIVGAAGVLLMLLFGLSQIGVDLGQTQQRTIEDHDRIVELHSEVREFRAEFKHEMREVRSIINDIQIKLAIIEHNQEQHEKRLSLLEGNPAY